MSKAIDDLKIAIAKGRGGADNENYLIPLSIAEGDAVLAEINQLQAEKETLRRDTIGHLEQALFYAIAPHPAAMDRIKEARAFLEALKGR